MERTLLSCLAMLFPHDHSSLPPPRAETMTPLALADACRQAALQILNEGRAWGSVDLAMWMLSSYAKLTVDGESSWGDAPTSATRVDPRMLGRALSIARFEVVEALDAPSAEGMVPSWIERSLKAGHVLSRKDPQGRVRFAPSSRPRRLADCILSLLATDYLVRPGDYARLGLCRGCGRIEIGSTRCASRSCQAARTSLVVPRSLSGTTCGMPEGA